MKTLRKVLPSLVLFLVAAPVLGADTSANPDRPFVSLSVLDDLYVSGQYEAITNRYDASQDIGGSVITVTGSTYLPINNKFTLHASVGTTLNHQTYDQTTQMTGYDTNTQNLSLSGGVRYYFLVRDMWAARGTENPERRGYFDFTATETPIYEGNQAITTNTWMRNRDISGNTISLTAYTNIPFTSRWAFQGQLSGSKVGSTYAQTDLVSGINTNYSTFEVMGGIRYYLRD